MLICVENAEFGKATLSKCYLIGFLKLHFVKLQYLCAVAETFYCCNRMSRRNVRDVNARIGYMVRVDISEGSTDDDRHTDR
jgi:hypothetical protein